MSIITFWFNVSLPSSSDQSPSLPATVYNPIPSDPALGTPGIEDQNSPCYNSECISSSDEDTKEELDFDNGEELENRDDMLDEEFVTGLSFIESTRDSDATVMGPVAAAGELRIIWQIPMEYRQQWLHHKALELEVVHYTS